MKWRPDKIIHAICRDVARQAARAIQSSPPREAHRDGSRAAGNIGGSFVAEVSRKDFVREERWGGVLLWQRLGQRLMWFVKGTPRQKPRPIVLAPDVNAVRAAIQADAEKFWAARAGRVA